LGGLARLPADRLSSIPNPLAAVGLRGTELADARGNLAELRFVRGREHEQGALRVRRNRRRDAGWQLHLRGVREPERERDGLPLHLAAVAGADELELALEALRRTLDLASEQRAAESLKTRGIPPFGRALDQNAIAVSLADDVLGQVEAQLALRALNVDVRAAHVDRHALRDDHRSLADAGNPLRRGSLFRCRLCHHQTSHKSSPPTLRLRASRSVMRP